MKKRFTSKALCMLLAIAMIMSLGINVCAAVNKVIASPSATEIGNGETVSITIKLNNTMPKFSGFNVELKFDNNAFDFIGSEWASQDIIDAGNSGVYKQKSETVAELDASDAVAAGFTFLTNRNFENLAAGYELVKFNFTAKDGYGGKYTFEINQRDFELGYNDGAQNVSYRGNLDFENTTVTITGPRIPFIDQLEDAYNTYNPNDYTNSNWSAITLIYSEALNELYNSTDSAEWDIIVDVAIETMALIPVGGEEEDNTGNNNTPQGPGTYIPQAPSTPQGGIVGGNTGGTGGGTGGGGGAGGGGGGGAPVVPENPDNNKDKETTAGGIVIDDTIVPGAIAGPEVTDDQIGEVESLYTDMVNHWASSYVYDLSLERGIFKGNGDGTFAPDIGITRQEISVALGRLLGYEKRAAAVKTTEYLDNETIADWARGYIAVMSEEKILLGDSDGNFYPEDVITREQLALILSRLVDTPKAVAAMKFNDVDKISEWAAEGCSISYTYGIIKGYPDNTFRGINDVTRSEAATMIYNFIQVTDKAENEAVAEEITEIAEEAY